MRIYYTGGSPENLRRARKHAPSHSHGFGWTPQKRVDHDAPYFLDHGFTDHFDPDEYRDLIDWALTDHPSDPDFIVLPDVYGAAEGTIRRHKTWLWDRKMPFGAGQCMRYWVLQPGLSVTEQFEAIEGCQGVFVGGPKRWKRAYGDEIVREARKRDLRTHVGNPGGADGLVWAYQTGFDSCDTTTVFQNQYWHYLEKLEATTDETHSDPDDSAQASLSDAVAIADGGGSGAD